MKDFAAIDFETANNERSSVCSVGIVIVRNGEIVDSFYSLIQPEPNYYNYWCTQVHGITRHDTESAPVFPEVWKQIEPLIDGLPLVAHNKAFDESCLKAVFRCYQMDYPDYEFHCTCQAARRAFPDAENHQLAEACVVELLVLHVKLVALFLLAVENLNDAHAGEVFRREGVPMGLPGLDEWHIPVTSMDAVAAAKTLLAE